MRTGAWATVDRSAIRHNVRWLAATVHPSAVWGVVKADGYGHGAIEVARAALDAGARGLCVALVSEAVALRQAGIDAPILVLSEAPPEEVALLADLDLDATVYTPDGIAALAASVRSRTPRRVHLKIDTGMHRVGADPRDARALVEAIGGHRNLVLSALWTHCAVADDPDDGFTGEQIERFDAVEAAVRAIEPGAPGAIKVHIANSAAAITRADARRDLVRCGIAVYGIAPSERLRALTVSLRPALSLHARVSLVRWLAAGDALSYGLKYRFSRPARVATIGIGYADGVARRLFETGGEVLIGGRRRRIVGVVTMDQLMVDCGDDESVQRGDEAVLIGCQGDDEITASEWATRLGTIAYEIVCGISARVPRRYVG